MCMHASDRLRITGRSLRPLRKLLRRRTYYAAAAGGHAQLSSLSVEPGGLSGAAGGGLGDFSRGPAGVPAGYGVLERADASAAALAGARLIPSAML